MRRIFIHSVLAVFLLIAGFDIAAGIEHWPFSNYPMYSGIARRPYVRLQVYGLAPSGEVPIPIEALRPFNEAQLNAALAAMPAGSRASALGCLFRVYERNRAAGLHRGPPMTQFRLYLLTWDLDAGATPTGKTLLEEAN